MPELAPVTTAIRSEAAMTLIVGRDHRLAHWLHPLFLFRDPRYSLCRRPRNAARRRLSAPGRLRAGDRHRPDATAGNGSRSGDGLRHPELLSVARPGCDGPPVAAGHDPAGNGADAPLSGTRAA